MDIKLHGGKAGRDFEKNIDLFWLSACELTFLLVQWGLVVALFRFLWEVTAKPIFNYTSNFLLTLIFLYTMAYMKQKLRIEIFPQPVEHRWKQRLELVAVLLISVGLLAIIFIGVGVLVNAVTQAYPNL